MEMSLVMAVFFALLFLGVPIAYGLIASSMLYIVAFSKVPMLIVAQQILKGVDSFTLLAVPFFIIAGSLMQAGGISQKIVDFAKKLVGHLPGGLAVVTTLASMIFAAMTGAGAATTAAVGGIMIPEMKKEGYDGGFACALQAIAGIFGPIIPPSILMVLYAVASGASVGDMLMAGILPGLVLGAVLLTAEVVLCIRKGYHGAPTRASFVEIAKSFYKSVWAMIAPLIILGGIYSGVFTPTEASAVCCFYCLIIGVFVYKGFRFSEIPKVVYAGVTSAASIMLIFAPIFVPTAMEYHINLIYFGVVMVVALCVGLVTPPVGINLFVASNVGGEAIHRIIPHVWVLLGASLAGLLILLFFPVISTILPAVLR